MHYPDGIIFDKEHYKYNLYTLEDSNGDAMFSTVYAQLGKRADGRKWTDDIFETDKECIEYLKQRIIKRLIKEGHQNRKMRQLPLKSKQVWWV